MQKNQIKKSYNKLLYKHVIIVLFLALQVSQAWANGTAITALNFSSLSGNKIQLQLKINGPFIAPKIFQTDNPARIALDFESLSSQLNRKMYPINQGAAGTTYVAEAQGKTRVVINLTETVPYETRIEGNSFFIVLKPAVSIKSQATTKLFQQEKSTDLRVSKLFPKQAIKNIDFRRGANGEGRILIELSTPNTVVDVKERGGQVILNFLNSELPASLAKSYDVSDFATPVQKFNAKQRGTGVSLSVTPVNGNYDYSSYQSDGLLTIDFIPLTPAEKEALLKSKFPYSGKKLTFNFQDIEVRSVLQVLADFTELNIIASDSVDGNVTLRLNDVPWDQALDLILKSKGLAKRQTGNVILVAPTEEIIKIEEKELEAKKIVEQLEPLRTEYIQINYAKAEEIQALLVGSNVVRSSETRTKVKSQTEGIFGGSNTTANREKTSEKSETQGVLSERGSSTVDARTNTIIVKDTTKQLEMVREMIQILDVPVRQVMIEARVVIADKNFAQEIGVRFGVAKAAAIGSDKIFAVGAGRGATYGNLMPATDGSTVNVPEGAGNYLVDLGANAINGHPAGALGMTLARAADYVLNLELSALENEERGEVLANPRVMTSDRELAYIKQGVQIPYETISQDGTKIVLVDAVLELNVTPQITPDGDVIMDLLIKKDAANAAGGIDKREVETIVRVKDGETIVLGGVYEGATGKETYKVPFFADLPGIGFLFQKKIQSEKKRELLIFVTPKIIKDTLSSR